MAVFNKNTLTQVSGFDNPIIAGELVWQQKTYWNLNMTADDDITPINLSDAAIDAQIIRRELTNIQDTRNGLTFDIGNYTPTPPSIPLSIVNRDDVNGLNSGNCPGVMFLQCHAQPDERTPRRLLCGDQPNPPQRAI